MKLPDANDQSHMTIDAVEDGRGWVEAEDCGEVMEKRRTGLHVTEQSNP